ncbi:uncharacterized protein FMAN_08463 [Fusarium mangiferae]|uniref:Uncharacterized protein n=1 Tax=Fusarium mangiferae TaxID=192010 RepID=A0A1L7TVA4_FUSMA|nr:uncharacterized protein FMAN_08463 [Fusarium mangiferae]CVK98746.1 uncharacterized protein FMAN_08463 [Fusarium mangiferae]
MPSFTTSIPGSDTDPSLTPLLQTQSSHTESTCKAGTNKSGRPQLTLMIPEGQDDISSEIPEDQDDSSSEMPEDEDVTSSERPSIAVKALRARQFERKFRTFDKDYKGGFSINWESVKIQWSLLCMLSMVYKGVEGEKGWPAEWEDEAVFASFLEETAASWAEDIADDNRVILEEFAAILGESFAIDLSSEAVVKEHLDRVKKFVDDNMAPVPEEDQGLEELELTEVHLVE